MATPLSASGQARYTVQRSKFHALAFPASSLDEVRSRVKAWKTKHRRARHTCWACRVPGPDGKLVEIIELVDHPWFIGCQFHPEFQSNPIQSHPLFRGFVRASLMQSGVPLQESLYDVGR